MAYHGLPWLVLDESTPFSKAPSRPARRNTILRHQQAPPIVQRRTWRSFFFFFFVSCRASSDIDWPGCNIAVFFYV